MRPVHKWDQLHYSLVAHEAAERSATIKKPGDWYHQSDRKEYTGLRGSKIYIEDKHCSTGQGVFDSSAEQNQITYAIYVA